MTVPVLVAAALLILLLVILVPRLLLHRAQDRLAGRVVAERGPLKLLTRAERVVGLYRRAPGVLALSEGEIRFDGLFGEAEILPTSRIEKVVTGKRMGSGRLLLRLEILRLTRTGGSELEFVMSRASASAWRSHLGLWAVAERTASRDRVVPGRS